jgi:integrase
VREKAESLEREAHTFASVMETYLAAAKLKLRTQTWVRTERCLRVWCESLHPLPFTAITRRDIAALLAPIAARGAFISSNNVRSNLSALFNWAIGQGLTESNPVVGTIKHEEKARKRVLSVPELVAIWHALDDITNNYIRIDYAGIVRVLMLTGQRRLEIGELRFCEIRDEETFIDEGLPITGPAIVLPPERTKNGCKHIVPLSKPAQTILLTYPRGSDFGNSGDDTSGPDTLIVDPDAYLIATGTAREGAFLPGTGAWTVTVNGTVLSQNFVGINVGQFNPGVTTITIGPEGEVGGVTGINLGSSAIINNAGTIFGGDAGIKIDSSAIINNTGPIIGGQWAILADIFNRGHVTLTNSGEIDGVVEFGEIAFATLRRAKKDLGIKSRKQRGDVAGAWAWELPPKKAPYTP